MDFKSFLNDFSDLISVIKDFTKPSLLPRHWEQINDVTKLNIPFTNGKFLIEELFIA